MGLPSGLGWGYEVLGWVLLDPRGGFHILLIPSRSIAPAFLFELASNKAMTIEGSRKL